MFELHLGQFAYNEQCFDHSRFFNATPKFYPKLYAANGNIIIDIKNYMSKGNHIVIHVPYDVHQNQ